MTISTNWQNHDLTPDATSGNQLQVEHMIDDSLTQIDGETVIEADLTTAIDSTNSPLILVVDDGESGRTLIRHILTAEGYRVIEAGNGEQALTLFCQFQPELVVLDWPMPVMDGLTCCQQLAQLSSNPTVPVVVLMALDDGTAVEQALTAGAADVITKPIHPELLRHRVRRLLADQQRTSQRVQLGEPLHSFSGEMKSEVEQYLLAMQQRTAQLHQSLVFETSLLRITNHIHDSLDENQILQTTLHELARTLNVSSCHAAIYDRENYDRENHPSQILKEYAASIAGNHTSRIQIDDYSDRDSPSQQGEHFPCCCLKPPVEKGSVIFTVPIIHANVTIGKLWLLGSPGRVLDDLESRLVQQVAHQCAIALSQARLYQKAQAQIVELEKLHQAKDDFLSTVSHELRSPLANIRLSIQMLERALRQQQLNHATPAANWQRIFTYLQILHDECEDEINLINDLLDLQRLETGHHPLKLDRIHLHDWMPAIIAAFNERVKERQQNLVLEISPDLVTIHSDHACLKRILVELLNNACKYAPPESTITVAVMLPLPRNCLQITVTNTGSEIPMYEQTRIFDKFYRIPNGDPWKQGGSGLGLALVSRLVEHLGGKINVNSSASQTSFILSIPRET